MPFGLLLIMNLYYQKHKKEIIQKTIDKRFGSLREVVILRDNEKCVNCGITRKQHKKIYNVDITVNHIDGTGRNDKSTNNDINNLETLCLKCHGSKDGKRGDKSKLNKNKKWLKGVSKSWFKKGRIVPVKQIELLRKRMITNNPFKGKKHSEETRKIMSIKAKSRWARKDHE